MCEECNQEVVLENTEPMQDYVVDEAMYNPIDMDVESVWGLPYDKKEFQRGINDVSRVCGSITALKLVGLPWDLIMDYLALKDSVKMNLDVANVNLKIAEKQQVNLEKTQL
jgi:hypothetical protein